MIITRIEITNVLGIEHFQFAAGKFNRIVGSNGAGKSSIIGAIETALAGGHHPERIRNGAAEGSVEIELSNGYTHRTQIKPNGTARKIKTPEGAVITAAQGWIEAKLNPLSFRPLDFVEADNDGRVKQLLSVAKLELNPNAVLHAVAGVVKLPDTFSARDPLGTIERVAKQVYDLRTGANRSLKDKRGHIEELRKSIPPGLEAPPDIDAKRAEWNAVKKQGASERKQIEDTAAMERKGIENAAKQTRTDANNRALEREREARAELVRKLAEIESEKTQILASANEAERTAVAEVNERERTKLAGLRDRLGPRVEELAAEVGKLEQQQLQWATAEGTRSSIRKSEEEAAKLDAESKAATAALERLESLKTSLLEQLPVPGLEIRNGELVFNGVLYDTLNTAAQYDVAMRIAAAAAGELKVIQLDGIERLDAERRAAVEEWALKSDCQFWTTRVVDDQPLTVTHEEAALVA